MSTVELWYDDALELGECPLWDHRRGKLLWVDAAGMRYYQANPEGSVVEYYDTGCFVSVLALHAAGPEALLLGTAEGLAWVGEPGGVPRYSGLLPYDRQTHRMNDGIVDPAGRFWVGTMEWNAESPTGRLYRLSNAEEFQTVEEGTHVANGLGFSPNRDYLYFTDSLRRMIWRYRYDEETGAVSCREAFIHTPDEPGVPDGLTVDQEGCIWSARWGGSRIDRYDASGRLLQHFAVPAGQPSSCCFGGCDLSRLYVTSATIGLEKTGTGREGTVKDGAVFVLSTDTQGIKENVCTT